MLPVFSLQQQRSSPFIFMIKPVFSYWCFPCGFVKEKAIIYSYFFFTTKTTILPHTSEQFVAVAVSVGKESTN
jgi:hypothetical protein